MLLRWLSLTLALATGRPAFAELSQKSNEPGDALDYCRAHAWVRAPDMVPSDVIAGDVKIKLVGPCIDAESYALGLRFKERVFWKLRRTDVPLPQRPILKYNTDTCQIMVEQTEWMAYQKALKDLWSVHEEERIAFEIKTDLISAEEADPLPTDFTTRFGILVPNTNYPPGIDYRHGAWAMTTIGDTDTIWGEFIYEYFVEIQFRNGTTSEIPAGMTGFAPFYLPTEYDAPRVNVSMARRGVDFNLGVDVLQSNYTIEVSEGTHIYQNSSVHSIMATVHRTGYTNRTDIAVNLCAFLQDDDIEWHPRELKNRSQTPTHAIRALVPSRQHTDNYYHSQCREVKFAAAATDLTREISSTSSEPLSLSFYVNRDSIPDFSTYYQKLGHHLRLTLHVKPDPSEPWENEYEKEEWERQIRHLEEQAAEMAGTDFDWVPWSQPLSPSSLIQDRRRYLIGQVGIFVTPVQKQGSVQSTPVHYLSDEARQPLFIDVSDINDLRSMSPEERDHIAPLAQPSLKVFAEGEEVGGRYFTALNMQKPIYVGETWAMKVLPMIAEWHGNDTAADHLLVVQ